jgi:biopolymer transport protein ExbB/TolQ
MNLVEWLQSLMTNFGAGWVMYLLIGLSVVSVAIMLERGWFYWSLRDDVGELARQLREHLRNGDLEGARKRMDKSNSAEAAVVVAGLVEADHGPGAAEQAMQGAAALQRMKLEKRLAYLATVGNNAPFLGLFGTVIGIVQAFEALGRQDTSAAAVAAAAQTVTAPAAVMAAIAEALVATAVGIFVAIPAVAAYNYFNRQSKSILANTEALSRVLLAHLAAVAAGHATLDVAEETPRGDD